MSDMMTFPDTVEEFMEQYKIVDTKQVYTNGTELVPIFRMKQWFEHLQTIEPERKPGHWERHNTYYGDDVSGSIDPDWRCSECGGQANVNEWFMYDLTDFCPHCGAAMTEGGRTGWTDLIKQSQM